MSKVPSWWGTFQIFWFVTSSLSRVGYGWLGIRYISTKATSGFSSGCPKYMEIRCRWIGRYGQKGAHVYVASPFWLKAQLHFLSQVLQNFPCIFSGKYSPLVDIVKYLGIIHDSKFYRIANLDFRIEKASITLWQCRRAYLTSCSLSPKVLLCIYTGVMRPILLYESFL